MKKTYQGSCHCGKVRFEADIDLNSANGGRRRCNCWICARQRVSETLVKPEDFRLLAGESELGDYQFGTGGGHHLFCRICGAATFGRGVMDATGGEYVSIAATCLDNANPALMPRLVASAPLGAARC
ncbi:MAG: GFA family protein [Paraburkholderia sp.]|jgi:hypothetical protein|uniref:GFA family protein n=1 Tax=Burkholderiaceae TaxID=119060 RepID=UPI0010F93794|nr:GFA family protein [Burkholderia sp. 4M9327F10]